MTSRSSARPVGGADVHGLASPWSRLTRRIMMSARASSAITFGARPPASVPMFSVLGPSTSSTGSGMRRISASASSSLFDGRIAQLGIGRVRHLAGGADLVAQRALASPARAGFRWARR